jgi:5-methylcytosine-specific restriction endonuclease McrA
MLRKDAEDWLKVMTKKNETAKWTERFSNPNLSELEWKRIYSSYLQSDLWKGIRDEAIARAGGKCEICDSPSRHLNVHHKTYVHVGGNELPQELEVLCFTCHQNADKKRDRNTRNRQQDNYYWSRVKGYENSHFEECVNLDFEEIEDKFIMSLYKKYCRNNGLDFDPNLDPLNDVDFNEFWDNVRKGYY